MAHCLDIYLHGLGSQRSLFIHGCILLFMACIFSGIEVDGQLTSGATGVCTTIISETQSYIGLYETFEIVTDSRPCRLWSWEWCTFYRLQQATRYRISNRTVTREINTCCEEWELDPNDKHTCIHIEMEIINPCDLGVFECVNRNFTTCVVGQNPTSYFCQNCKPGLTEFGGVCVDPDVYQNKTGHSHPKSKASPEHQTPTYVMPIVVAMAFMIATILLAALIVIKFRHKIGAMAKRNKSVDEEGQNTNTHHGSASNSSQDIPDGKHTAGSSAASNRYEYTDLELYLTPNMPNDLVTSEGYTGLRPNSQGIDSIQKHPQDGTSEQKYEFISYKSKKSPHQLKTLTDIDNKDRSVPMFINPMRQPSLLDKDHSTSDENHYEDVRRGSLPYVDMESGNNNIAAPITTDIYESMDGSPEETSSYMNVAT